MKNILVTGGAGYIGSKLVTKLLDNNFKVTVLDKLNYSKKSLSHLAGNKRFIFIKWDVINKKIMKSLLRKNEIIITLAALVGAPLCEKKKSEAIAVNYESIKLLMNLVNKKHKIIYLTTNSGYGVGKKNKHCDENSPLNPISLYGSTKVKSEKIIMKFKNSIAFRLATVFGNSYRMRSDLMVNNFVLNSLRMKKLTIYEPNFRRNFIHINDVVSAIIFSINNFNKLKSNIYNLGLS